MSRKYTPLQLMCGAVRDGDVDEIRRVLAKYPEQLTTSLWLHDAARAGSKAVVDCLLAAGLELERKGKSGDTPLTYAIRGGQIEMAKYLLSLGADPSSRRMLISALNAEQNSFELVKLLVEHGADVNQWWRYGDEDKGFIFNALSWAIDGKQHDIADYLRAHGAVMPPSEEEVQGGATKQAERPSSRDAIVEYFARTIGPVDKRSLVEIVPTSPVPISLHVIPAGAGRDSLTLFTTGMSDRPMNAPPEDAEFRFAELMIQLPADWPLDRKALAKPEFGWPVRFLREIAAYPHLADTWLGGIVTIYATSEPPPPLAPGCPFTSLLLIANYEDIGPIPLPDGRVAPVYTMFPLYTEERALEVSEGVPELFRRLELFQVSTVVDLKRPNVARQ